MPKKKSTRNFNFELFYEHYKQIYPHKPLPSVVWLTWFIGFTEEDGSFMVTNKGDLMFVITQSTYDVAILHDIMNTLGFGRVITQNKTQKTSRFIVQDQVGSSLIVSLFNGNIVLPTRHERFLLYLNAFNLLIAKPRKRKAIRTVAYVEGLSHMVQPSLKDAWITGFTDSEGCFHVSFVSINNIFYIRISYILSQKGESNKPTLEHIKCLFGAGVVGPHSKPNNWTFIISGVTPCFVIYDYFAEFPLKSKKAHSFEKWQKIHLTFKAGKHLDPLERIKLVALSKLVNPKIDLQLLKVSKPVFLSTKRRRLIGK
jgi:LAGLIDADG endonuclease